MSRTMKCGRLRRLEHVIRGSGCHAYSTFNSTQGSITITLPPKGPSLIKSLVVSQRYFSCSPPSALPSSSSQGSSSTRQSLLPEGWEAVIGVECHAQIKAPSKLFSPTPLPTIRSSPNTLASPFDASHPGTLPILQPGAVQAALRAALFLNCEINPASRFDRKHYFYPDLTAGYQITQKYSPLANRGWIKLRHDEGYLSAGEGEEGEATIEIEQVQLEQDTAKSSHLASGESHEASSSFIDLNRAGAGLMEIVSGPQMRSAKQAGAYIRKLQELLRRVGASDGNMDEGSLRCDVNVSVHRIGEPFGKRCEVKNVNSVKFVMNAIESEVKRQYAILERGEEVEQQTRGYDEETGQTIFLRGKEDAPDYRYMPDPNLPPVRVDERTLQGIKEGLPEHPDTQRDRLKKDYKLSIRDINVLMRVGLEEDRRIPEAGTSSRQGSDDAVTYFEAVAQGRNPQVVLNWVINELLNALNKRELPFQGHSVPPAILGELIDLVEAGRVTGTSAKALLVELVATDSSSLNGKSKSPVLDLLTSKGMLALGAGGGEAGGELEQLCAKIINDLPKEAEKVRKGNDKVVMRLVGEVMKRTAGRADAQQAREVFLKSLRE
ncbi:Glutamyl-tRNA amidotransferase B subunit [Microstroma glucosiphilum]|uniref:Glutamyl-tRNA(Gln) amidotransferase subunit B, mitochondrial n=1 Tax=Pseudomicrostroma glucosiphilum TaxID=1684307 RepID=A0A316UD68_9BASI|nr:Glutamyl-tRNA amidotransferase B subunit [Pseudomicrostroma glucosiphilum]PWN22784.1 Glutamyl-tRNA amidotransferase B subunit [Pseudomicrostroma glucosiphilum]